MVLCLAEGFPQREPYITVASNNRFRLYGGRGQASQFTYSFVRSPQGLRLRVPTDSVGAVPPKAGAALFGEHLPRRGFPFRAAGRGRNGCGCGCACVSGG